MIQIEKETQIGQVYKPNTDKIIKDFGNALEMCKAIGMSYGTYNNIIRLKKKKRAFTQENTRIAFFKLVDGGYIHCVGESNENAKI